MIPFFARYFASLAADANRRVGEEPNLDTILDVRVSPLVRALETFADHFVKTHRRARRLRSTICCPNEVI